MNAKLKRETYILTIESCPVTGRVISESWSDQDGCLNSVGGNPAYTKYDEAGDVIILMFAKDGLPHRTNNLPSSYTLDKSKDIEVYQYEVHGKLSRTNGPAIEKFRSSTGECIHQEFWINGRKSLSPLSESQPRLD